MMKSNLLHHWEPLEFVFLTLCVSKMGRKKTLMWINLGIGFIPSHIIYSITNIDLEMTLAVTN